MFGLFKKKSAPDGFEAETGSSVGTLARPVGLSRFTDEPTASTAIDFGLPTPVAPPEAVESPEPLIPEALADIETDAVRDESPPLAAMPDAIGNAWDTDEPASPEMVETNAAPDESSSSSSMADMPEAVGTAWDTEAPADDPAEAPPQAAMAEPTNETVTDNMTVWQDDARRTDSADAVTSTEQSEPVEAPPELTAPLPYVELQPIDADAVISAEPDVITLTPIPKMANDVADDVTDITIGSDFISPSEPTLAWESVSPTSSATSSVPQTDAATSASLDEDALTATPPLVTFHEMTDTLYPDEQLLDAPELQAAVPDPASYLAEFETDIQEETTQPPVEPAPVSAMSSVQAFAAATASEVTLPEEVLSSEPPSGSVALAEADVSEPAQLDDFKVISSFELSPVSRLFLVEMDAIHALMGECGDPDHANVEVLKVFSRNPLIEDATFNASLEGISSGKEMIMVQLGNWKGIISRQHDMMALHTELTD